jgi:hypothetical protein
VDMNLEGSWLQLTLRGMEHSLYVLHCNVCHVAAFHATWLLALLMLPCLLRSGLFSLAWQHDNLPVSDSRTEEVLLSACVCLVRGNRYCCNIHAPEHGVSLQFATMCNTYQ